jgi:glycerate 2-kinase
MIGHMLDKLRQDARAIFGAGLDAADSGQAVRRAVHVEGDRLTVAGRAYDLAAFEHVILLGAGKAAPTMARAIEDVLGERIARGLVVTKHGHALPLRWIKTLVAGHPMPDAHSVEAARQVEALAREAGEKDLVVLLLSGGGSALLAAPIEGVSLGEKQATTQALLRCGAPIHEINAIRKHLSRLKGGRLAQVAAPATVLTLIVSDVVGDRLDAIASGPTAPDTTTFEQCTKIVEQYDIKTQLPAPVVSHLRRGAQGDLDETPKPGDPAFDAVQNVIIANNALALDAARAKAAELGYAVHVLGSDVQGEAREVAVEQAKLARQIAEEGRPVAPPACLLSGGETTVTVRGTGAGGRNQEFALAAAIKLDGAATHIVVLSAGTDGTDGPTDAAGAIADTTTCPRARRAGLDPVASLGNNDSHTFFRTLGDLLVTGPTGTNVMDVRLFLLGKR